MVESKYFCVCKRGSEIVGNRGLPLLKDGFESGPAQG